MSANGGSDDSAVGDRIMTACLTAAGESPTQALADAQRGGLYTLEHDGLRIQCLQGERPLPTPALWARPDRCLRAVRRGARTHHAS
jgi:hypothetical protein